MPDALLEKNGNFFQYFSTVVKSVSHPVAGFASVYVKVILCQLLSFVTKR